MEKDGIMGEIVPIAITKDIVKMEDFMMAECKTQSNDSVSLRTFAVVNIRMLLRQIASQIYPPEYLNSI